MAFPILTGQLLDRFPHNGYPNVFGICSVAYLVAFALNHFLAPSFEPAALDDGGPTGFDVVPHPPSE